MTAHVQVVNDLLDESRTNLRMREDPAKGFYVERLTSVTLLDTQHALSCIAAGDAQRKAGPWNQRQSQLS